MNTIKPEITFACELVPGALKALVEDPAVIDFLQATHSRVAMGIMDLSDERADAVRCLNESGIPLTAWLLLPREQGYWFNLNNYTQARQQYHRFKEWSAAHGLRWDRVGLDIEPEIQAMQRISAGKLDGWVQLLRYTFNTPRLRRGAQAYQALIEQIHADGYMVEAYQSPFIVDERIAHSTLLQRAAGLVDLPGVDQEIVMLYSSFMRPWGQGVLWSYAPYAGAIGLGSTGGGVEYEGTLNTRPLNWAELETDLLLAYQHTQKLFIFSLEGCVQQGFLPLLRDLDWNRPTPAPLLYAQRTDDLRKLGRRVLRVTSQPAWLLFGGALVLSSLVLLSRRRRAS